MKLFTNIVFASVLLTSILSACTKSDGGLVNVEAKKTEKAKDLDPMHDKGLGPITSVKLTDIDAALAGEGKTVFEAKCTACHKLEKRKIGPSMAGVTTRRSPEWIMNMILNPDEMVQKNPIARQLLMEYSAPMANQSLTEAEARSILEFFRENDFKQLPK